MISFIDKIIFMLNVSIKSSLKEKFEELMRNRVGENNNYSLPGRRLPIKKPQRQDSALRREEALGDVLPGKLNGGNPPL